MTPHTGQKIITIHILPNISRRKSHQAMKFDQLVKHSFRKKKLNNHSQN